MKAADKNRTVLKIIMRLPGRVIITSPAYEVLEGVTEALGVENLLDFELLVVVDDNRRRRGVNLALERVCCDRFQKGDVKDWMDFHTRGKFQLKGMGRDLLKDLKLSEPLIVELG